MNELQFNISDQDFACRQKFLEIMKENLIEAEQIGFQSSIESLKISSLIFIKIVVFLEMEFNIEFEDEKIIPEAFATVQELFDYVYAKTF